MSGNASAHHCAPTGSANPGNATPLKAKAGAATKPAADSPMRCELASSVNKAPSSSDRATNAACAAATSSSDPGTGQPRPTVSQASASAPTTENDSHGHASLASSAASTGAKPAPLRDGCAGAASAVCSATPSQPGRVPSRSSRPTAQAPVLMASTCSNAATSAAPRKRA